MKREKKNCWECDYCLISRDETPYCVLSGNIEISQDTVCDVYDDDLYKGKEVTNFRSIANELK